MRYIVHKLGFRYYSVHDTRTDLTERTFMGVDAEARAHTEALTRNAHDEDATERKDGRDDRC